jgi:hypothetical protein
MGKSRKNYKRSLVKSRKVGRSRKNRKSIKCKNRKSINRKNRHNNRKRTLRGGLWPFSSSPTSDEHERLKGELKKLKHEKKLDIEAYGDYDIKEYNDEKNIIKNKISAQIIKDKELKDNELEILKTTSKIPDKIKLSPKEPQPEYNKYPKPKKTKGVFLGSDTLGSLGTGIASMFGL